MRITRFENFLNESINEARDLNDPVLLAIRASKEARKKSLAVQKENMK